MQGQGKCGRVDPNAFDVILIPVHIRESLGAARARPSKRKVHWRDSLVGTSDASEFTPFIDAALEWLEWVAGHDIATDTWTWHVHSEHVCAAAGQRLRLRHLRDCVHEHRCGQRLPCHEQRGGLTVGGG